MNQVQQFKHEIPSECNQQAAHTWLGNKNLVLIRRSTWLLELLSGFASSPKIPIHLSSLIFVGLCVADFISFLSPHLFLCNFSNSFYSFNFHLLKLAGFLWYLCKRLSKLNLQFLQLHASSRAFLAFPLLISSKCRSSNRLHYGQPLLRSIH